MRAVNGNYRPGDTRPAAIIAARSRVLRYSDVPDFSLASIGGPFPGCVGGVWLGAVHRECGARRNLRRTRLLGFGRRDAARDRARAAAAARRRRICDWRSACTRGSTTPGTAQEPACGP